MLDLANTMRTTYAGDALRLPKLIYGETDRFWIGDQQIKKSMLQPALVPLQLEKELQNL